MLNMFNNTEHNTTIKDMMLIAYAIKSLGDQLSHLELGQSIMTNKPVLAKNCQRNSDSHVWSRFLLCVNETISKHNTTIHKLPCQHLAKHYFCSNICGGESWLYTASRQTGLKAFIFNFLGSQMLLKIPFYDCNLPSIHLYNFHKSQWEGLVPGI